MGSRFYGARFLRVVGGVIAGTGIAALLVWWAIPRTTSPRPAVLSTLLVPIGCGLGWALGCGKRRVGTAIWAALGLYLLSAFAAARLVTLFPSWNYWRTLVPLQAAGGLALAVAAGLEVASGNDPRDGQP
ncbi:MAG: hypothetical protein ACP5SI_08060 [Chloroflexia bacterium]